MGDGHSGDSVYVAFFVVACVAMTSTIAAIWLILRWGDTQYNLTKLMLAMYATLLLEEIFTLPFAYSWDPGFCAFAAFVHTFSGVANSFAVGFLMSFFYCSHSCDERVPLVVSSFVRDWAKFAIFVFPLITLLPFSTGSYGKADDYWCRIKSDSAVDDVWSLLVYHLWIIAVMLVALVLICKSIYAACKIQAAMGMRLFSSLGLYAVVSFACWFFRIVVNLWAFAPSYRKASEDDLYYAGEVIIHIQGIAFALILFYDVSIVIEMRSGSEVFNKSSFMSASMLNWEGVLSALSDARPSQVSNPISSPNDML